VETAADFHVAIAAGVDEVEHVPGFRGNERGKLPELSPFLVNPGDAALAGRRSTIVVTTLGGAAYKPINGKDSALRVRFDSLARMNISMLKVNGVRLVLGSDDYKSTSLSEAKYIQSLRCLSNAEILTAWADGASAMFPARQVGKLKSGYEASFLVLAGNPLTDFSNLERILLRVKDGAVIP
jgi:imidazolonepropionase-like amidohydrolase